ncbi:glycoside hydrolase family 3 N-terminal domain-containing protein [Capillimicrobium parvum]|uniref:glycoside hydrolase family 3 N-terminal domain-containing protein n=1 Tax=Capillimicrobium parvum TaxID=2884022 RepID=UPI00216B61EC|nr:glycoside hydrolase family 3 N-terminal domain-containing protein [Capillimicrobium parvum]
MLRLPVEQAAAQLFAVGFGGTSGSDPGVRRLGDRPWGAVVIEAHNARSPAQVRALVRAIRRRAGAGSLDPPVVAISQAGGELSALPSLPPPPEPEQEDARVAAAQATRAAQALRPLGIELTLAPVADLAAEVGPAASTGFSPDPAEAAERVAAAVRSYRAAGLASAPRSFPGEGGASQDPLSGPATVGFSLEELRAADVRPFAAVAREAPVIQMSDAVYAAWDGVTPATLAPEAYDLLRRGLRFGGVAMTGDLNAVTAVTGGSAAQAAVDALRAGADLLWIPGDASDQEAAYLALVRALQRDEGLRARAAEALNRLALLRERYANP